MLSYGHELLLSLCPFAPYSSIAVRLLCFLCVYSTADLNTGEQDQSPIDHMSNIAQVALVISLVCNVVMGVNEQSSNFILTALSLLLFLAFQLLQVS